MQTHTKHTDNSVGCALIVVLFAIVVACSFAYKSCDDDPVSPIDTPGGHP